jgi:hypothetical protein
MKRKWNLIFLILGILLIPILAMGATTFKVANQITFAWDPVTKLSDGSPLPAGSTIQYQAYSRTDPSGAPVASGLPIATTQATVTFAVEGQYDVGVKVMRLVNGAVVSESAINWSNDPTAAQGGAAFGASYYLSPGGAGNLRSP